MRDPKTPNVTSHADDASSDFDDPPMVRLPGSDLTRQAIRNIALAPKDPAHTDSAEIPATAASIPTIRGRVTERLKEAPGRATHEDALRFKTSFAAFRSDPADERGALALACLVLEQIRRHGGAQVPARALREPLDRLLAGFDHQEAMAIEVEAYEIFEWLGQSIDPGMAEATPSHDEDQSAPNHGVMVTLEKAIALRRDVILQYFTGGRVELTRRKVTPLRMEAEKYLHAYCHKRQDDRVFRISRIRQVAWVHGSPPEGLPPLDPPPETEAPPPEHHRPPLRAEASRAEASRAEASRAEASRAEASRAETPRAEARRVEATRAETTRAETTRVEAPRAEATRVDPRDKLRRAPRDPQMSLLQPQTNEDG